MLADKSGYPVIEAPEVQRSVRETFVFRHPLIIRLTHWVNVVCMTILLMSGLQIFNAHPMLYWGNIATFDTPAFSLTATDDTPPVGKLQIGGQTFNTTGFLGVSNVDGAPTERGFPTWITLPAEQDLATARRWHFLFAWAFVINGLAYLLYCFLTGQMRFRIIPSGGDLRQLGHSIIEHLTFNFPHGRETKRYNVLQKLTYFIVICVLLPLQIFAGLAMSPGMDSITHFLPAAFGGRQSARTIHFIIANLLVLFVVVHVAMVLVTGLFNNLRAMISGWFVFDSIVSDEASGS